MADEDFNYESEAIYGNSEAILFHQLTKSGQLLGDIKKTDETEDEQEESDDSYFSDDEDLTDGICQPRIQQEEDEKEVQEENIQDGSCNDEDDYVIVLEPRSESYSRVANRWKHFLPESPPSTNSSQCHQDRGVPWKPLPSSKEGSSLVGNRKRGPLQPPFQRTDSQKEHFRTGDSNALSNGSPAGSNSFLQAGNATSEYLHMSSPNIRLEDGKYVTLTPLYQKVIEKPYFHLISRNLAKELVTKGGNGAYVIRPSFRSGTPLTITVNSGAHPYHVSIRELPDGLFALGSQKKNEKTFSTIDEIVRTYCETPLTLANGTCARLKFSPQKTTNAYVDHVPGCRRNQ